MDNRGSFSVGSARFWFVLVDGNVSISLFVHSFVSVLTSVFYGRRGKVRLTQSIGFQRMQIGREYVQGDL